ncbi:MAG: hypothetical protein MZV64_49535 [Ignavibacteriales bacterium]|nr:hypothetical protein [Ignavibacteriales bacterium]
MRATTAATAGFGCRPDAAERGRRAHGRRGPPHRRRGPGAGLPRVGHLRRRAPAPPRLRRGLFGDRHGSPAWYTLNTNGTLITPAIARLLRRTGTKLVALYGATAAVHDAVTRRTRAPSRPSSGASPISARRRRLSRSRSCPCGRISPSTRPWSAWPNRGARAGGWARPGSISRPPATPSAQPRDRGPSG